MPRASWNGFLKLSLVSCPVYLSPATTESKRIRLNQLNAETGNRLKQQLIDSETGEVVERDQIAKGYEFERGRYVTLDDDELKALQIESSKIIDLSQFVSGDEVDPVYLDAPYYVYPDGALATEAFRVIGEAMAAKGLVGLGRVTIASRERLVLTEPRGAGLLMWTLRSSDEVRAAEFDKAMVARRIQTCSPSPRQSLSGGKPASIRRASATGIRTPCANSSRAKRRALRGHRKRSLNRPRSSI
jgi:DNA end-binding protein Ku